MKKIIILFIITIETLFGYISINNKIDTSGGNISSAHNKNFITSKIGSCSGDCSNVWFYNATTTDNLKLNEKDKYLNPKIIDDNDLRIPKNLSTKEFIKKGIEFFKKEDLENSNNIKYNIFFIARKIKKNLSFSETITKADNDFSVSANNKTNYAIRLNDVNVFNSYLFGQVETSIGLITAYVYRNRIFKIGNDKYHFIELEKVNFLDSLITKYNEYCSKKSHTMFPFIYEPNNFYYSYANVLNNTNNYPDVNKFVYPSNIKNNPLNPKPVLTGLIGFPCDSKLIGNKPYKTIKNLKIILDPSQVKYYDNYPEFGKQDIINDAENYFYDNGYALRIPELNDKNILKIATSFFSAIMQDRKIETGIIVKSNHVDIKSNYWKSGKCPRHFIKKTLKQDSEIYYISSLSTDMPFTEMLANFDSSNSLNISSYSPIPAFPSDEETIYALTPDNHILSNSISKTNSVLASLFPKNNFKHDTGYSGVITLTRSWQQHCKSFGFFSFILVVVLVVIAVMAFGAASGIWHVGGLFTTASASTPALLAGTHIAASTIGIISALLAYNLYGNIWTGKTTSPGVVNSTNYNQTVKAIEGVSALGSGSSIYMDFYNIKQTLDNMANKVYGITPKQYKIITNHSYMVDTNAYETQYFGFNTTPEIGQLFALAYKHANPASLPPGFRFFTYKKEKYDSTNNNSWNFNSVPKDSDSVSPMNLSLYENGLLNYMYGYTDSNCNNTQSGYPMDIFNTKCIMEYTLNKFDKYDITKYEK